MMDTYNELIWLSVQGFQVQKLQIRNQDFEL